MAIVSFHDNPLAQGSKVTKEYNEDVTLGQALEDLEAGENQFVVNINGEIPEQLELDHILKPDDIVNINIFLAGGQGRANTQGKTIAAITTIIGIGLALNPATSAIGVGLIVQGTIGFVTAVINRIPNDDPQQNPIERASTPVYSLNAAGNNSRPFSSLPLCLSGRGFRFYPDYDSKPYGGYQVYETFEDTLYFWQFEQLRTVFPAQQFIPLTDLPTTERIAFNGTSTFTGYPHQVSYTCFPNDTDFDVFRYGGFNSINGSFSLPGGGFGPTFNSTSFFSDDYTNNFLRGARPVGEPCNNIRFREPCLVVFVDPADPNQGSWTFVENFNDHRLNGAPLNLRPTNQAISVTIQCLRVEPNATFEKSANKIYHHFNFGFGDLEIIDDRLINTDLNELNSPIENTGNTESIFLNNTVIQNSRFPNQWPILPLPFVPNPLNNHNWDIGVNLDRAPFESVDQIEGGELQNNIQDNQASFNGPAAPVSLTDQNSYNWIFREGPEHTFMIEIDLEGVMFRSDPVFGIIGIERRYQFQYRRRDVGNGTPWIAFPGLGPLGELTIRNGDTHVYRRTLNSGQLPIDQYEIRGRRIDLDDGDLNDDSDANDNSNLNMPFVRFFQDEFNPNIGENRKSIEIVATGQVQGNIGRYSANVRNKCWVYNPVAGTYSWDFSSNPADLYLYFLRGGYYNESADGSFQFPFSPTIGWVNSGDHPDSGERMWGCGLREKRIDFDSIQQWWVFCDERNLTFDHYYAAENTCFEILKDIAAAGRASPSWHNGSLGVVFEDPDMPVSAVYGMFNIRRGSFNINYNHDQLADEIIGQYIDREDEWISREVKSLMPNAQTGINEVRIDLTGVTDRRNAQRESNLLAARQYYQRRTITFETDIEGFCSIRGDVIGIQHDLAQWEFSSRISDIGIQGMNITSAKIMCEIDKEITDAVIRLPDGELIDLEVSVSGSDVEIVTELPSSFGPMFFGENGENQSSVFVDSCAEDFILFLGSTPTPFKRARITELSPVDQNTIRITAVDEDPAIYSREFVNVDPEDAPDVFLPENQDHIRPCASIFEACVIESENGVKVSWQTEGAIGVEIYVSINGAPEFQYMSPSGFTLLGTCAEIPAGPGDVLTIRIEPVSTGEFDSQNEIINFEVPNG